MRPYTLSKIRNRFKDNALQDISNALQEELGCLKDVVKKNASIAIAVGSRGIDNLVPTVRAVAEFVIEQGGNPFIVPAMGSHGGATATGQANVLAGYGITEKSIGAPIRSSMEVVEIPAGSFKGKIFMDRQAYESDGVILVNKIKPHTDFRQTYESGLVKMAVIGLGKQHGAKAIHRYGVYGLTSMIPDYARQIFATQKILAGIALIENAYDKTMAIRAIPGKEIMEKEPGLLELAKANRPAFPVNNIDVLLIDRMGKNISGVGMDTNIIGRIKIQGQPEPTFPDIKSIVVTDLTEESHGNATGTGLADVVVKKLYDKIHFDVTYKNVSTSGFLERGKIPVVANNDFEALKLAIRNSGCVHPGKERIVRIKDTLHLDELYVSAPILDNLKDNPNISIIEKEVRIFDDNHQLFPF